MARSLTQIVAKNTTVQLGGRVATLFLSLLTVPFITRALGPNLYGQYSLVLVYLSFVMILADFGIQQIAVREMAQNLENAAEWIARVTLLRLAAAVGISLIAIGLMAVLHQSDLIRVGFAISLLGTLFIALQAGFQAYLQAALKVYDIALADLWSKVVTTVLTLAILWTAPYWHASSHQVYFGLIGVATLAYFMMMVFVLWFGLRDVKWLMSGINLAASKKLMADAFPLWIMAIFSLIHYRIDVVILSFMKGNTEVGFYNTSYKLLDITLTFSTLFMATIYPLLSQYYKQDPERFKRIFQKSFDFLAILGVSISAGTFLVSAQVINILGGEEFARSIPVLQVLTWTVVVSYLNAVFGNILVVQNRQTKLLVVGIATVIGNILLNLMLIPHLSGVGSALATVLSESLGLIITIWLAHQSLEFRTNLGVFGKSVLSAVVMLVLLWPIRNVTFLVVVPAGALVFVLTLWLVKGIDPEILRELKDVRRGARST